MVHTPAHALCALSLFVVLSHESKGYTCAWVVLLWSRRGGVPRPTRRYVQKSALESITISSPSGVCCIKIVPPESESWRILPPEITERVPALKAHSSCSTSVSVPADAAWAQRRLYAIVVVGDAIVAPDDQYTMSTFESRSAASICSLITSSRTCFSLSGLRFIRKNSEDVVRDMAT